jgi:hypothetical protein
MESDRLTVQNQAIEAAKAVNSLFRGEFATIPKDATVESLWEELQRLKGKIKKPKKVAAVKLLLEDERLTGLSIPLLADIIKKVFHRHGVACDTSDSSIRWYISQKTLDWDIKAREKRMIEVDLDD